MNFWVRWFGGDAQERHEDNSFPEKGLEEMMGEMKGSLTFLYGNWEAQVRTQVGDFQVSLTGKDPDSPTKAVRQLYVKWLKSKNVDLGFLS